MGNFALKNTRLLMLKNYARWNFRMMKDADIFLLLITEKKSVFVALNLSGL